MAFFDIKPLIKEYNPQYTLIYGQRSNGKSWSVKELVIDRFCKTGEKFLYVRRYDQDLKAKAAARYFEDFIVEGGLKKWSKGKYKNIAAYSSEYIAIPSDKEGEKVVCGYYIPLSTSGERLKSQAFPDVTTIIFEEFLTHRVYLEDEFAILSNLVSTVARNRLVNVIMIGNTVSRVCPYFPEMGINDITDMDQGTHKIYHQFNQRGDCTDILCVHTPEVEVKSDSGRSMFFGRPSKMILSGEWDIMDYPRRPKGEYETHYEICLNFPQFNFIMQFQTGEDETPILFVYPNKHNRHVDRILQDEISADPMITRNLREDIRVEPMIHSLWMQGKVFYSDNLTGNDFNTSLLNSGIKL